MNTAYTFKIGGEAGFGIMSAGLVFSRICTRSGYFVFNYSEYPSLIRGGHNVMQVSVSDCIVTSQYKHTNFLVALNQETLDLHFSELTDDAILLCDLENKLDLSKVPSTVSIVQVPLLQIVRDVKGSFIMRNVIALGAAIGLLGGNLNHLKDLISEEFGHKKEDIIKMNHLACSMGYDYILKNHVSDIREILLQKKEVSQQIVLTGNEAVALGALSGGVSFVSVYPMTPTSNIMHTLAPYQEKYGFIYKQPEDEISAINMAIGASFAGARSMVATSGGGFCLMSEGYGLAGITETPLVIIEGMRAGPATGLPTWSSQGDLRFILHAHQDDFPRIILSAGDINEAFELTARAFNIAEKYQTPVVILVDKYLCEGQQSVPIFDTTSFNIDRGKLTTQASVNYLRYADATDGISLRSIPGSGNHFVANSDEHDEIGYSSEGSAMRIMQMEKRMRKLTTCYEEDMDIPALYGDPSARLTIVSWGSNKGPILEALKNVDDVNFLYITWINPFPDEYVKLILSKAQIILNVECNYTAQMCGLIAEKTGIRIENNLLSFDGRPWYPEDLVSEFRKYLK